MNNIFLLGFMGCGKTTVGRALATLRSCGFVDLDEQIEGKEKKEISRIFEECGEPYFRDLESRILMSLDLSSPKVVALGGGTFTFKRNIDFIQRHGISVFLDSPFELVLARCEAYQHRPLFLRDPAKLAALFHSRMPFYLSADHRVVVSNAPPETVARGILKLLERL